jgi:hypothetical protein
MDPQNEVDNLANVTIIYNCLDEVGNFGNPKLRFFKFQFPEFALSRSWYSKFNREALRTFGWGRENYLYIQNT